MALNPHDGYSISLTAAPQNLENVSRVTIGLVLRVNGRIFSHQCIAEMHNSDKDKGECLRLKMVLDAVCRYMNTGGNLSELITLLNDMSAKGADGLQAGNFVYETTLFDEDEVQHIFVNEEEKKVLIWSENAYAEFLPLETWIEYCRS